jgi:hypothetical protein
MLSLKVVTLAVVIAISANIIPINAISEFPVLAQTPNEPKAEADRLLEQGIQQGKTQQFQEALQSDQQALEIYREIGDR